MTFPFKSLFRSGLVSKWASTILWSASLGIGLSGDEAERGSFGAGPGESVPVGSGAGLGELCDLLPGGSQHENLAFRFKAKANSIEIALVVSEVKQVGLIEDAKFLDFVQIGRPLRGFRSASSMMFLVEKVSITIALGHLRKEMTRLTAD